MSCSLGLILSDGMWYCHHMRSSGERGMRGMSFFNALGSPVRSHPLGCIVVLLDFGTVGAGSTVHGTIEYICI